MNNKEFPEEAEVLIGTVGKIIGTSVFVRLEGYDKDGVISFSEVAPGRIRNIRDYVKPGQRIVCKILRVDKIKGHVDLSLRRVSAREKKEVLELYKREKDTAVLLGLVIKEKDRLQEIIQKIKEKISLAELMLQLQEIKSEEGITKLKKFGLSKEEARTFMNLIAEKVKQKFVSIKAELLISSEAKDGIKKIKSLLSVPNVDIKYISAPRYLITIKDKDYKEANKKLKEIVDAFDAKAKNLECNFEFKK